LAGLVESANCDTTVAGVKIFCQGRGSGNGIGVKAGHRAGAVHEHAGPENGEPFAAASGLVLAVQRTGQIWLDQGLGLAGQYNQGGLEAGNSIKTCQESLLRRVETIQKMRL
jgi:hypothetical protein